MTEQEAREKLCPHITYCENPYQVAEGMAAMYVQQNCIASSCMAWRWAAANPCRNLIPTRDMRRSVTEPKRPEYIPASWSFRPYGEDGYACWIEPEEEAKARRVGYCGLAGKP